MHELPEQIYSQLKKLSAEGDAFAENGSHEAAIAKYNEAWLLIPDPPTNWDASTWLLAAIGDSCFQTGYFTSGCEALEYALHCPDGLDNPFIRLRLGQCHFEKGNFKSAAEHLARAYMAGGLEVFASENGRYVEFLKTKLLPPASGKW